MPRLGQHFLINQNTLKKIAETCGSAPFIIEIGPGHGELTKELRRSHPDSTILCIERDPGLINNLKTTFADKNVSIISGNALEKIPDVVKDIKRSPYIIVGNIPYYITGHLFRVIGSLRNKPETTTLLIQKEVADRLIATEPHMNRLSASVLFWGKPKILSIVDRKQFNPPPKVDSAIIQIQTQSENETFFSPELIDTILGGIFRQPRKTLLNNIASAKPDISRETLSEKLKSLDLSPAMRPQELTIGDIKNIAKLFK